MMEKAVFLNFKTYETGTGKKALEISKIAEKVSRKTKADIIAMVQPADLRMISSAVGIKVFAQSVSHHGFGSNTGRIIMESLIGAGAKGAMINHSECRVGLDEIKLVVEKAKRLNFPVLVCVENLEEAKQVAELKPDYIAFEDKELIGSGKSITASMPDAIKQFVSIVKDDSIPLCGAGVSTNEDFRTAVRLGARGVLLASAIMKAENPEKALMELVK